MFLSEKRTVIKKNVTNKMFIVNSDNNGEHNVGCLLFCTVGLDIMYCPKDGAPSKSEAWISKSQFSLWLITFFIALLLRRYLIKTLR